MVAVGAHTDEASVQSEIERIYAGAQRLPCYELVLFVDAARRYDVLRHPGDGVTVRFPLAKALRNGTAAYRTFVSHQLLMAALPAYVARHRRKHAYESVWVIEEDSRFSGD